MTQTETRASSSAFSASSHSQTLPPRGEFVISNGRVVSMDAAVGDLLRGDVHVRHGAIIAVGKNIAAPRAETVDGEGMIVMPGFVETHWHLWNSLHRNLLRPGLEYFPLKAALSKYYAPVDFYRSSRLALAEALNAGITTVHNFAHNVRTPQHADAELKAFAESGVRGRYSYGWNDEIQQAEIMPADDVGRVQKEWIGPFSPTEGRVDLGMSLRGPMYCKPVVYNAEFKLARDLGLPVSLHSGQTLARTLSAAKLRDEGFLESNTLLIHFLRANEKDREIMAERKVSLSLSMQSELRNQIDGDVREQLLLMIAAGVNVSLSIDSTALGSVSMFDSMSLAWYMGIPWNGTATEKLPLLDFRRCIEMGTTNGAKALGIADKTGSLTPGKRADIIMIRATDLNMVPLGEVECAIVRSATVANVDTVIIDGRILKRGGKLVGVDVEKVKHEANESLMDVLNRTGGSWSPKN